MTIKIFDAPYGNEFKAPDFYSEDGKGHMHGSEFFFTGEKGGGLSCDWLVVADTSHSCFYTNIPRERRILFIVEPPEIRKYKNFPYYLEQFGTIISPYDFPNFSGRVIVRNPCLGWTAGMTGAMNSMSKALNFPMPYKNKIISIITSLKQKTEYHRKRVEFLRAAQKEFAGVFDCFGRDFNPINDKLEAITPYKYHIVIENSRHKFYWSEKLIDAWAGWSLPIYCGDPSILEQLPDKNGLEIIDVEDMKNSLKKIHEIIESDIYSERINAIKICRQWAIKYSNRYELTCEIIKNSHDNTPKLSRPELFKILIDGRKGRVYNFLRSISKNFADKIYYSYCKKKGRIWE